MRTPRRSLGRRPPRDSSGHAVVRYGVVSAVALIAVLIPRDWRETPSKTARTATVPVVVAAKDVAEGAIVDRLALVVAQWPAGTQPAGAYTAVDSVANRVARVAIYKGEAIMPGRLEPDGLLLRRAARLTPGKRAYGIRINDVASLAGMIQPNSRVDIMIVDYDPDQGRRIARLFMSNMRVLAIGAAPDAAHYSRPMGATVASIEVTPAEAERLAIAAAQGPLQLVLRAYGDVGNTPTQRRGRTPQRSRIVPSPARLDSLPPTVFRRNRSADMTAKSDSTRRAPD